MRFAAVVLILVLVGCGGGDDGVDAQVEATMRFDVTQVNGLGPSPLDPLEDQTVDISITLDDVGVVRGEDTGCKQLAVFVPVAGRTARGATAALVQTEILDKLANWDVSFALCDDPTQSTLIVEAAINELNVLFGCNTIPAPAQVRDAAGFPLITTFTATDCSATILDVVNNRDLGAFGFTIAIATASDHVP